MNRIPTALFVALLAAGIPAHGAVSYHGGPVLVKAHAIFIFWGPSFQDPTSPDHAYAQTLIAFRNQLGTSSAYSVLTEYYEVVGGVKKFIQTTNLGAGTPDWFDTSTPPTAVTDSDVQAEVVRYLASHALDASAVYELFIPRTSYADDGSGATSCGGPNLAFCAYHSFFLHGGAEVHYAIEPYPSCGGCAITGFSDAQVEETFVCHQTRETVTDPDFNQLA